MEVCLLAMQGLGKPGRNQFKYMEWGFYGTPSPMPESGRAPLLESAYNGGGLGTGPRFIPKTLIPQAILSDEPVTWHGRCIIGVKAYDQFVPYQFPREGDPTLHMIWTDTPCWSTCWNGGNEFLDAMRSEKLEFVLAQHPWLENDCLFADIILPTNTKFEEEDICNDAMSGTPASMLYEEQAIEPVGESRSDWEAVCAIADKLGLLDEYTGGRGVEECIRDGFDGSGIDDLIDYETWKSNGYVSVPYADGWEERPAGFAEFCDDPEGHPLGTPSGKLEIYSTQLAAAFPEDKERRAYPHYIEESEEHHENLAGPRAKDYPFLLVSNHPRWRVHANMDDITWLRELSKVTGPDGYAYEPVWINPTDAHVLGVSDGDVVKVYNERGWVLGGAVVTERIMPGAVLQDHGSRLDPIVRGEGDRGGANNTIAPSATTSRNAAGEVTSGFLVGVEKVDVFELSAAYPEAFSRTFDAEGVEIGNWIIEGDE